MGKNLKSDLLEILASFLNFSFVVVITICLQLTEIIKEEGNNKMRLEFNF